MLKFKGGDLKSRSFRYVNTDGINIESLYTAPDFLMIGPQRTGTTWLSRYLVQHPEIFIPAEKELYYFNYLKEAKGKLFHSNKLLWYLNKFEPNIVDFLRLNAMNMKMMGSLPKESLNWFQYQKPRFFGEATASYAAMDETLIEDVLMLNPNMKVIMMVRNPIERAWSHAKKDLLKAQNKQMKDVPFAMFAEFYQRDYQKRCGQYREMIQCWQKHVSQENFLIKKFVDVKHQPQQLFDDVCQFLGVQAMSSTLMEKGKVVNPTTNVKLPEEHQVLLSSLFAGEIEYLTDQGWL